MKDEKQKRDEKNKDLIRRMRAGESIALYKQQATWFQPRPVIKKDEKLVQELFKKNAD